MIVLILNSGSTSIKLAAFDADASPARCLASARIESLHLDPRGVLRGFLHEHQLDPGIAVHRVVHGGTKFSHPVRVDATVREEIAQLSELAPLHNPRALEWLDAAIEICGPRVTQVAAFDTAYFANLPRVAAEYAVPARIGTDHGVRRYGFHGLAHESLWRRWCELYPELTGGGRLITLQLGGGCSITAIDHGHPVDHSMGFSPLEGLVMATRCGDIDAAVIPYLQRNLALSSEAVVAILNRESGLLGLAGQDGNPGALLRETDAQAQFAVDLYCYRARKYIGAYLTVLGGCDGIVFGGGVGEHVPGVRERILSGMGWAGIELDPEANAAAQGAEAAVQASRSAVRIHVIPADEESILLQAARTILDGK